MSHDSPARGFVRTTTSWTWFGAFSMSGLAALAVGSVVSDQYLQSVLANVGTTLLLVGLIAIGERRLARTIESSLNCPRSLEEAKIAAKEILADRPPFSASTKIARVEKALSWIHCTLEDAGFRQVRPDSSNPSHYEYRTGERAHPSWRIDFTVNQIQHTVFDSAGRRLTLPAMVVEESGQDQEYGHDAFTAQMFNGLLFIVSPSRSWTRQRIRLSRYSHWFGRKP